MRITHVCWLDKLEGGCIPLGELLFDGRDHSGMQGLGPLVATRRPVYGVGLI